MQRFSGWEQSTNGYHPSVRPESPLDIDSDSAKATDDVWAVGEGMVFPKPNELQVTYHWDGSKWSNVPNPDKGVLYGVSGSSNSDVWAVGAGLVTPGTHTIHYVVP